MDAMPRYDPTRSELSRASRAWHSGDPITELAAIRAAGDELIHAAEQAVADALVEGKTWKQIGDALGLTRTGAHARYGHLRPLGNG